MRRRKQLAAFSLFSFQDIITSVTGIIILLTLFLALQLIQREAISDAPDRTEVDRVLEESIQQVNEQIDELHHNLQSGQQFLEEFAQLSPTSLLQEQTQLERTAERLDADLRQLQSDLAAVYSQNDLRRQQSADSATEDENEELHKQIEDSEQQLKSLKAAKRIVYNVAPNVTQTAWLTDVSNTSITVRQPGSKDIPIQFSTGISGQEIEGFMEWAKQRDATSEYFVLLVRPKSLASYRQLYQRLDDLKFAIGVDLLEQDAQLADFVNIPASQK